MLIVYLIIGDIPASILAKHAHIFQNVLHVSIKTEHSIPDKAADARPNESQQ